MDNLMHDRWYRVTYLQGGEELEAAGTYQGMNTAWSHPEGQEPGEVVKHHWFKIPGETGVLSIHPDQLLDAVEESRPVISEPPTV